MTPELQIKEHPVLHVLCREDGAVCILNKGQRTNTIAPKTHWSFGKTRGRCKYLRVSIRHHDYSVHRLIAETFLPNVDNKPTVDHINRNRVDNRVDNLRWADLHEQQLNQTRVDNEILMYGVRYSDDPRAYYKAYDKAHRRERTEAKRIRRAKCWVVVHG